MRPTSSPSCETRRWPAAPRGWRGGWVRRASVPTLILLVGLLLAPASPAEAYIGPGAGLGAIGAFIGLVGAVLLAIGVVVLWPIRRMIRKARAGNAAARQPARPEDT